MAYLYTWACIKYSEVLFNTVTLKPGHINKFEYLKHQHPTCIYRPPQDSLFFNHFRNVLENIWLRRKNIILLGDFNSDMLKGSSKTESQYGKRLKRIISSFGLKNIMSCPSRVTLTLKSLIDLIITNQPAKVKNSGAIDLGISDHNLVFAVFMTTRVNPKPKYITTIA